MEMQRAVLTLANLENFAAVEIAVDYPYLALPPLGDNRLRGSLLFVTLFRLSS